MIQTRLKTLNLFKTQRAAELYNQGLIFIVFAIIYLFELWTVRLSDGSGTNQKNIWINIIKMLFPSSLDVHPCWITGWQESLNSILKKTQQLKPSCIQKSTRSTVAQRLTRKWIDYGWSFYGSHPNSLTFKDPTRIKVHHCPNWDLKKVRTSKPLKAPTSKYGYEYTSTFPFTCFTVPLEFSIHLPFVVMYLCF